MARVVDTSYKLTNSGEVQKVPQEIYMQEGVECHFGCCGTKNPAVARGMLEEAPVFLIMSMECVIEALPLLEEDMLKTAIFTRSVLSKIEKVHASLHRRLERVIDRRNLPVLEDRNSEDIWRFIQQAEKEKEKGKEKDGLECSHEERIAEWYRSHTGGKKYVFYSLCSTKEKGRQRSTHTAGEYLERVLGRNPFLPPTLHIEDGGVSFPFLGIQETKQKVAEGALERGVLSVAHRDGGGKIQCGIEGHQVHIEVPFLQMNRAVDGDVVAVETTERSFTSSTGRVVGVEQRSRRVHACTVYKTLDSEHVLLKPILLNIPYMLARATLSAEELDRSLVLAWIEEWREGAKYPEGHIIRAIGKEGHIKAETEALLSEYSIVDQPFEEEAEKELPPSSWALTQEDLESRADFRSLPIASIDPEGCVDIDDALHARYLPNGAIEIGVHIADVTHFVKENSALDREGRIRGCSVYLPNRRIDMLPSVLGTNLCSLHKQKERLTFSIIWEVEMPGASDAGKEKEHVKIVKKFCTKSVICSRESFSYQMASDILKGQAYPDQELVSSLHLLKRVSSALKKYRREHGAFEIHSTEFRISSKGTTLLNELSAEPDKFIIKEAEPLPEHDTHTLVEEFMLLANHNIAEMIARAYPKDSLIRVHPSPTGESFKKLESALCVLSPGNTIRLDPRYPSQLSSTLETLCTAPNLKNTIGSWAAQCMTQAVYAPSSVESRYHYGLGMDNYTHFTSPIRRYPDILVHRLAISAMKQEKTAPIPPAVLKDIVVSLNRSYRKAKQISREANLLHVRHLIANEEIDLCVTSILPNRIIVHCPEYGVDGSLQIESSFRISLDSVSYSESAEPLSLLSSAKGVLCSSHKRELVFRLIR